MLARFCYLLGLLAAFVAGVLVPCPQAADAGSLLPVNSSCARLPATGKASSATKGVIGAITSCAYTSKRAAESRADDSTSRERDYVAAPIVHEHESPEPTNRFFDLAFRNDGDDDGNSGVMHVGVITAKQSKLAQWLASHDGERIALSLRAGGTLNRDGESARSGSDEHERYPLVFVGEHPLRAEVTR